MKQSAYGKIILLGEHAVVYDKKGIAMPLKSLKVTSQVKESTLNTIETSDYHGRMEHAPFEYHNLLKLIHALKKELRIDQVHITLESNFLPYAGLGFSASAAASLTKALYQYAHQPLNHNALFNWIQYAEKLAHENPSGIDASTVISETPLVFQKSKQVMPFDMKIEGYLVIAYSGIQGSTKDAVKSIAENINTSKTHIDSLGHLTEKGLKAIQNNDIEALGNVMNEAHEHLIKLHVSHEVLDKLVTQSLHHGAIGAKMSGGGLGGVMIALCTDLNNANHVKLELEKQAPKVWIEQLRSVL